MAQTVEQQRARHAWECARQAKQALNGRSDGVTFKDYVNAAKGMPALIMNSGLMQVAAYFHGKQDDSRYKLLGEHLRAWLHTRCKTPTDFSKFMDVLFNAEPPQYRRINAEAMAWLRWLRQMAAALQKEES